MLRPMKTSFRLAFFAGFPFALRIAVEDHVDALEDEAIRLVLEGQDAFRAQDVRPLALHQIVDPGHELVGIDIAVDADRDRLHVLVVKVLQAVIVVVMMIVIVVVMVMLVGGEEFGLDLQDAVEIEGIAAEHVGERHLAARRLVQLGIGVDGADARLDLAEFGRRSRDRSC